MQCSELLFKNEMEPHCVLQAGPNSWVQVTLSPQPPRSGRDRCERYCSGPTCISSLAEMSFMAGPPLQRWVGASGTWKVQSTRSQS